MASRDHRVLLLEFNEITWTLIDPLIRAGALPNFQRMRDEGAWGAPVSVDEDPHLDPWVTWVTVHTGVPRDVHGATVLEQSSDTIRADRTWQYAARNGKTVGVFGSVSAYPPQPVPGFIVPGPFAPGPETYPDYLAPVQKLNRGQTRVHNNLAGESSLWEMARDGVSLVQFGLRPKTVAKVAAQLAAERLRPHTRWKRIALQPEVNFDFFRTLYARYQPDYATWHSNHVAHYMHHYWRAHDDSQFAKPESTENKRKYGKAVEHGYRVADELLGRFMEMVDDRTVLVVASSMGQKPYVADKFPDGRIVVTFRDIEVFLRLAGLPGVTKVDAVMAPQWNLTIPDAADRKAAAAILERIERRGQVEPAGPAISVTETDNALTINPKGLAKDDPTLRLFFSDNPEADAAGYSFGELMASRAPTPKQGMHDPTGTLLLWGADIRPGVQIEGSTNLDIAPTLLTLLGIEVPKVMTGRVLGEAWGDAAEVPRSAAN